MRCNSSVNNNNNNKNSQYFIIQINSQLIIISLFENSLKRIGQGSKHTRDQYVGQAHIPMGYTQGIEIIRCNRPLSQEMIWL